MDNKMDNKINGNIDNKMANEMDHQRHKNLEAIRHTFAHVLAGAVSNLFGPVKFGMGPAVENGFYYDFELDYVITEEDFEAIEIGMKAIIRQKQPIERRIVSKSEALEMMIEQPYKLEIIASILQEQADAELSVVKIGEFVDLCSGLHVESLSALNTKAFKLERVSGAYWKGDSKRPMLQRVYGSGWELPSDLKAYQRLVKEAAQRDHRVLAKQMDLFSFDPNVGLGLPLWHPNGAMIRFLMERFSQSAHILNGYQWVYTPHIGKAGFWETSGHLDFYKDSMYSPMDIEGEDYYLKPMSCPFHVMIYNSRPRSYKELPVRLSEFAAVYRYELSGALQGLSRVRGFTQDDAHIICMPSQAKSEIAQALRFSLYILRAFGFRDFKAYIATKPPVKSIGSQEDWDLAIDVLKSALVDEQIEYAIDEGGGAFYGPKIDLKLKDALGRQWQCSTIQFDFNLPERFEMAYIGQDGCKAVPMMVHRALFGSVERFFSLLVEHYKGAFPLWLAPVQIGIVPVSDEQLDYAIQVKERLLREGLRVMVSEESQSLKNKIKVMAQKKLPILLVVGNEEVISSKVSVRGDDGQRQLSIDEFLEMIRPDLELGVPKYLIR